VRLSRKSAAACFKMIAAAETDAVGAGFFWAARRQCDEAAAAYDD
jgi:hypothetical protein